MPALMAPFPVLQYIGPNGAVHQCRLITNTDLHNVLACDSMLVNSSIAKDKIIARLRQHLVDQGAPKLAEETDASFAEPDFYALQGFEGCDVAEETTVVLNPAPSPIDMRPVQQRREQTIDLVESKHAQTHSTVAALKTLASRSAASLHALTQNTCLSTTSICSMRESIKRPQYTLAQLCAMAILLSSPQSLSSRGIIDWIASTFRYYRTPTVQDWKKCIRNILYTNKDRFERNSMQKDQFVVREESKAEFVQVVEEMRTAIEHSGQQDRKDEMIADEGGDEMSIS